MYQLSGHNKIKYEIVSSYVCFRNAIYKYIINKYSGGKPQTTREQSELWDNIIKQ